MLLVLAAAEDRTVAGGWVDGITRLEKMVFLAAETCRPEITDQPLRFHAGDYGPHSPDVYEAVLILQSAGLVQEDRMLVGSDLDLAEELLLSDTVCEIGYLRRFCLTDAGREVAALLSAGREQLMGDIAEIKERYSACDLSDLLFQMYREHPAWFKRAAA